MAKKSSSQIWLEYAIVRVIFGFFSILPRKLSIKLGMALARFVYPFLGKLRRVALRNLEIAFPEKSDAEHERLAKASFENLGRILGEFSQFHRLTPEKLASMIEFNFEREEIKNSPEYKAFEAERAKGRGIIPVGPHLGNWEIGVFAYSALQEPFNYLARPLDNPRIEEMTVNLRTRFGNRAINKNNSVGTALEILNRGGVVGFLADVNVLPRDGVFVPFFGVPACTTSGAAMLALRTNAMIIPMCCVWDERKQKYIANYGKLIEPARTGDRKQDIWQTTAAYTAALEEFIRAYPDQWLWIHKRWKTRPPGEKELY